MISFDPAKRLRTLKQGGLDVLDAESVFAGPVIEFPDRRRDYGEHRIVCFGLLRGRAVIVVYTERSGTSTSSPCARPMNENSVVFSLASTNDELHSDLQRVDAYRNQADDYAEIPEISEDDLADAVIRRPGQPDQPFLQASANPPD